MFTEIVLHTLKKRARSLMMFIIIILIFWRTDSWTALINYLNMQLIFASLINIVLILIFSIITFTIEQATMYMKHKKIMRVTIFFKYTDFVELSLIESMCIFFSFMSFDCAIILFFLISFLFFHRWCCYQRAECKFCVISKCKQLVWKSLMQHAWGRQIYQIWSNDEKIVKV